MKRFVAASLLSVFALFSTAAVAAGTESLFAATLTSPDGQEVRLGDYRGKPLIVNFWARWCAPCRTEIPELVRLRERFGKQGLNVIGVGVEDDPVAAKEFLAGLGVNYPVGLSRHKGIWMMQALGNAQAMLPFTLVIDRDGEIVVHKLGVFRAEDFEAVAAQLLQ